MQTENIEASGITALMVLISFRLRDNELRFSGELVLDSKTTGKMNSRENSLQEIAKTTWESVLRYTAADSFRMQI